MQSESKTLKELIELKAQGYCSPEEEQLLLSWIKQLNVGDNAEVDDAAGVLLKQRIDLANNFKPVVRRLQVFKYAAACILIAGVAFFSISKFYNGDDKLDVTHQSASLHVVHKHFKRLINASTKPVSMTLEDGSVVSLQPKSELLWELPFPARLRKVELSGKAFFEVAKNKAKPFVVYAGNLSTSALGTSFWVDQNKNSGQVEVKLITGKVVIKHHLGNKENVLAYLIPGQKLNYVLASNTATVYHTQKRRKVQPLQKVDNRALVFNDTPLTEVFASLERFYGVKIRCTTNAIKTMTFYGSYSGADEVENILNTIVSANELKMSRIKNTFIITK